MRTRNLALAIALATTGATYASSSLAGDDTPYSGIYAFGDSLTDAGNLSVATESGQREDIAINQLANQLGLDTLAPSLIENGTNWAMGGARSADVLTSIIGRDAFMALHPGVDSDYFSQYSSLLPGGQPHLSGQGFLELSGGSINADALYYINGGGNDVFAAVQGAAAALGAITDPTQFPAVFNQVLADTQNLMLTTSTMLSQAAGALSDAGAKYVVLSTVPLVGSSPAAAAGGQDAIDLANVAAETYNNNLISLAKDIDGVLLMDMRGITQIAAQNPGLFGFATDLQVPGAGIPLDQSQSCYSGACNNSQYGAGMPMDDPSKLISADGIHPTVAAQAMLADYYAGVITASFTAGALPEIGLRASITHDNKLSNNLAASRYGARERSLFAANAFGDVDYQLAFNGSGSGEFDGNFIGGSLPVNDQLEIGLAVSNGGVDYEDNRSMMDSDSSSVSLFSRFYAGKAFFEASMTQTETDYDSVKRKLSLGSYQNEIGGETAGESRAYALTVGADVLFDTVNAGPLLSISRTVVDVDGYTEDAITELTYMDSNGSMLDPFGMHFGKQERSLTNFRAGAFAAKQWSSLSAYGELWYEDSEGTDSDEVEVGIKSMAGNMNAMRGYDSVDTGLFEGGVGALLGVNWNITQNFQLSGNYARRPVSETASLQLKYAF
ncbi:SGNH/GDSL hydrolase family protein [Biformimicrobium ophioploci]|nr:SGNH/GDSL hydrolase family protein [Microbulbifer sp. NKW57]